MEQFADGGGDQDGGGGGGGGDDACDEGIISSIVDCTCIHATATLQQSSDRGDAA